MNRKEVESAAMESSSSDDAEEEEEEDGEDTGAEEDGEEESGSDSSSDDDEFDSADDRVNIVPDETETVKSFAQVERSDESESEEEEEEEDEGPMNRTMKPAEAKKVAAIKSFDSDVESEYESESGSEPEGLTQKTKAKESSLDAEEALSLSQKKAKQDDILVHQGIAEDDHLATKRQEKTLKQELKTAKIDEGAMKGQGGSVKQILEDNEQSQSVKDEKKRGLAVKKRKIGSTQNGRETDSGDSVPVSKTRKAVDAAQNGKAGADRDKPVHTAGDTAKEIARKTLSDPSAKSDGSKDSVINKVATVDHKSKQPKKVNADASKGLASPQKQKKLPHVWSTDEEITMASQVLNRVKMGLEVPIKKNDDFWVTLSEMLHKKLGIEFSRDQLSEKLRRMKQRYQSMAQKIMKEPDESHKSSKYKTSDEQNLFDIWSQIWGRADLTFSVDREAASNFKKEPSRQSEVPANSVKERINSAKVSKTRPASKAKANKENAVENSVGRDGSQLETITTVPMDLDKGEAKKEDHATADLVSFPNTYSVLSKEIHKLLEDNIHITLNELEEWSKNSLETWMNKALALIENSAKTLEDQARFMNATGITGGAFPTRHFDSTEFQLVHGERAFQQQWYELRLQELNIYCQRLELMQKECKLKQEQLKLQLQLERGK